MEDWKDRLIEALEDLQDVAPDAAALRAIIGPAADESPMTLEEFLAFARELLAMLKESRT